jgi:uncharacterized metal-binding protein YceD (DUF177 family)
MDYLKQFVIPFFGLKNGLHHYKYNISDEFFENFPFSEVIKGKLQVNVILEKQERMLVFEFEIDGYANVMCDRCSGYYDQPVKGRKKLIVKFGEEKHEETDEILILPESQHQINISSFIYEYIILMLPYKRIHPYNKEGNSTCNPEIIRKLEEHSKNRPSDSRWDVLKNINLNLNQKNKT